MWSGLEFCVMWAVTIENNFPLICVEDGWVEAATFRPINVDGASLAVVKDASAHRILQLTHPIPLDNEEILKAKTFYSCYI